jgi:hypothetical protein
MQRYVLLCSRIVSRCFHIYSFITFFPETDSGIGEQKANPHWVDQGANHLSCLFWLLCATGLRKSARFNLKGARIQFPGQLFYSS